MCSVASFVGNILIVLTVYKTKKLRTTTNLFIVDMAASDIILPALDSFLHLRDGNRHLTQTLGTVLCKLLAFLVNNSYGVSMSNLVVITVYS